ncbi:MAG: hypothetical protein ABIB12_00560 [Patescibacteria group bacterium]
MRRFFLFLLVGTGLLGAAFFFWGRPEQAEEHSWGVTFSHSQAESLGLDWQETYLALLDDLGVRHFRIPVYWDELEKERGSFDFSSWDWQLRELEERNGKVILAMGLKLPRWPECRMPSWAAELPQQELERAVLDMLSAVTLHYRDLEVVETWQVENEYLIPFGECPERRKEFLGEEAELVRSLDGRPVMLTDGGIASFWLESGRYADILGFSVYRFREDETFGFLRYPFPPATFWLKAQFLHLFYPDKKVVVTELQAEPWPITGTLEGDYETMNPAQFREHIAYAKQTGFDEFYLWGAEWWYWTKEKTDDPRIWNYAKEIFQPTE